MMKARYSFAITAAATAAVLFSLGAAQAQRGGSRGSTGKMQIPVQKSGKVVVQDGSPLPETVLVEASCGGSWTPIARTDSKGGFIVGRGRESDVDARSQSGTGGGDTIRAGCQLRARLPGYLSSILPVTDTEKFDLGTIILSRPAGVEGTLTSATSLRAPKPAQKAFEKAQSAVQKKKLDEARPQLEKAVETYPEYAEAWLELGRIQQTAGELAQAHSSYEKAIKADPKFVKPYVGLAGVMHKEQNWQGAADTTATLIKLDPYSYISAYVINSISNARMGKMDLAETSATQAVKLDTTHLFPEAEYTLGLILDSRGDAKGALEHLRAYIQYAPNSPAAANVKGRIAELEQASGANPPAAAPAPK